MKIIPLAFDSLGTRSMSTFVETDDVKILIDPGVALGPSRYGLSPHPIELSRLKEHWNSIKEHARKADVLIITHYHYDHYNPDEPGLYGNKVALVKHPTEKINHSQMGRAAYFLKEIKGLPSRLEYSDGKEFRFGNTLVKFSQPVFHGTNSRLGYVTEVLIVDEASGYRFIHTSDVEGPAIEDQVNFILQNKPNVLFLDGPLSYMLGFRYSHASLELSVKNIEKVIKECPLDSLVVDHHFLRDLKWKERLNGAFKVAEREGIKLQTAADFSGKKLEMLEAMRKKLYSGQVI
ncbi:MAG: MBL fold metallo-hydrolase [Candidatus Diapherotrites archaeon]|nr:MBL fold metallo-hydrolase [Candidatus Diapherotrites archaeon]